MKDNQILDKILLNAQHEENTLKVDLRRKIEKYMVALLALALLRYIFSMTIFRLVPYSFGEIDTSINIAQIIYYLTPYFANICFAIFLFINSRKEIINARVISFLALLAPLIGLIFYFIQLFVYNKKTKA